MNSLIYNAGTVSVSGGSAIVEGNLTGWAVALVEGGVFSCDGLSIPILSVEDDTHLTLAYAWPGAAGSGKQYAIARTPSEATARAATWTVDRLGKLAQTPWGVGVVPDGRGTLAQRNALNPMPNDDYCWLRVEVDQPLEYYFRVSGQWLGPYVLKGDASDVPGPPGGPGPAGPPNTLTIGTVQGGDTADAEITGSAPNQELNLTLPKGNRGDAGSDGWTPIVAVVADGVRRVQQVIDWVGGTGTKPATGQYVGPSGFVSAIGDAVDIRGASGSGTGDMLASVYDPANKAGDAFAMDNMAEGTDTKIMTAAERSKISALGTAANANIGDFATAAQGAKADTAVQPEALATVATSGSYNDLSDKPAIPAGTVTSVGLSAPTGFTVSGSPVTGAGTLTFAYASGYTGFTTTLQTKLNGIEAGAQVNLPVGTGAGTVAAGNDSRITGAVQTSRSIATQHSLQGGGNLSANRTLSLAGDVASPGNNKVYGTDASGERGWKDDPAGGGIGVDQTWQDVTGSRVVATAYQNLTGKVIAVSVTQNGSTTASVRSLEISENGSAWTSLSRSFGQYDGTLFAIIRPNQYYRVIAVSGTATITSWMELR